MDWLIENVHLVEITAYSDGDAYTIFETMNDRGLSLTPADMLKGYLLANITDDGRPDSRRAGLEGAHQCAGGTRQGRGCRRHQVVAAEPVRRDDPGPQARRAAARTSISSEPSFTAGCVITRTAWAWRRAATSSASSTVTSPSTATGTSGCAGRPIHLTPGLECVYFNAEHNFTLQYPVLLSPLRRGRRRGRRSCRKVRVTAAFLDILIHRRIWNWRAIDYSTMQYAMFLVMRDIRGKSAEELAQLLRQRLDAETETFQSNESFRLHGMNGRQIHRLLARMTDFVETRSGHAVALRRVRQAGRQGRLRDRAHLGGSPGAP